MATYFGPLTYRVTSEADKVTTTVAAPERRTPAEIVLHLRLPEGKRIASVTVNGAPHADFDADAETVTLPAPAGELVSRRVNRMRA